MFDRFKFWHGKPADQSSHLFNTSNWRYPTLSKSDLDSSFSWLISLATSGCIIIAVYSLQFFPALSVVGRSLAGGYMAAVAATLTGALLGFLFGIPRTLSTTGVRQDSDGNLIGQQTTLNEDTRYVDNSNLEQLSDWLTKILVGIGLTQLPQIRSGLGQLTTFLAPVLGDGESARPFALSLLIFFTACGFLHSYLWTRTEFIYKLRSLAKRDSARLATVETAVKDLETRQNVDPEITAAISYAIDILNELDIAERLKNEVAQEEIRTKLLPLAIGYLKKVHRHVATDRRANMLFGRLLRQAGELKKAAGHLAMTIAARRQAKIPDDVDTAALLYNLSCYLNLQARALEKTKLAGSSEMHGRLNQEAKNKISECIAIDPTDQAEAVRDADLQELWDFIKEIGATRKQETSPDVLPKASDAAENFPNNPAQH